MSTALPLDLELSDLESARDEAGEVMLDLAELAITNTDAHEELKSAIFTLASVRSTLIRAIDACASEAES